LTKDGYGIVAGSAIISFILVSVYLLNSQSLFLYLGSVSVIFTVFCVNFFRDPDTIDHSNDHQIISPAQGKVVQIRDIEFNEFIGGPAKQISIFLNVFNIHVNSHPIGGTIRSFTYQKGKMLAAFNHKASEDNEQTIIAIENDKIKLVHKQITGLIARRIVCRVKEGQIVKKGERFGMIKFGSRCDVIVPSKIKIVAKLNQKVERGETVIGEIIG